MTSKRLALIVFAAGMSVMAGTLVSTGLPAIGCSLSVPKPQLPWVMASYLVPCGVLVPFGGSLGDRFDRSTVLAAGLGMLAAASLLCGSATTLDGLLLGRALQGAGAAAVLPNASALIGEMPHSRRLLAIHSAACTAATVIGPLVGSGASDCNGWRWTFAGLAVAAGAAATYLALRWRSDPAARPRVSRTTGSLTDRRSVALLTIFTAAIYGAFYDFLLSTPGRLAAQAGYTPIEAGAAVLPASLFVIVAGPALACRFKPIRASTTLALSAGLALVGTAVLAASDVTGSYWGSVFGPVLLIGAAMALVGAPLSLAVIEAAGPGRSGVAAGLNSAAARLGGAAAVALHEGLWSTAPGLRSTPVAQAFGDIALLMVAIATAVLLVRGRVICPTYVRLSPRKVFL